MGLFGKGWLKSSDDELRSRKSEIESETDWSSGSILDGDFDDEIEAMFVYKMKHCTVQFISPRTPPVSA